MQAVCETLRYRNLENEVTVAGILSEQKNLAIAYRRDFLSQRSQSPAKPQCGRFFFFFYATRSAITSKSPSQRKAPRILKVRTLEPKQLAAALPPASEITMVTLPPLQKNSVNIFFVFAWEFYIGKWRGFLVNFFWSPYPTKRSTKSPRKIRGKFGEKFRAKSGTKIWKIRGTFVLRLFWLNNGNRREIASLGAPSLLWECFRVWQSGVLPELCWKAPSKTEFQSHFVRCKIPWPFLAPNLLR